MPQPIQIDIWSDIACPWCFLGKRKLEAALQQFDQAPVEVIWHSYQLSPDLPRDYQGSHSDYLKAKLGWNDEQLAQSGERLSSLGEPFGIRYNFKDNKVSNTHRAHEALHFAKEHGRQNELAEAIFKAHFTDGLHIGEIETLVSLAQSVGLDGEAATEALTSGRYAEAVEADKETAARIGVNGVPFFVLQGKYGLSGAQDPELLLRALTQVAQEAEANPQAPRG